MTYIRVTSPEEASGELQRAYEVVKEYRGDIANVFQAHSLRPETMLGHLQFYMSLMFAKDGLDRAEREILAVVVSAANNCSYCVLHHSDALRKYEKNVGLVQRLGRGEVPDELSPRAKALAKYARKLTKQSFAIVESDIEALREADLSDDEILLANLITSYYNFVNRLVDGLGVEMETEPRRYKY